MRHDARVPTAAIILLLFTACATGGPPRPADGPAVEEPAAGIDVANPALPVLNATVWLQTSAEYVATARQAYLLASRSLPRAIADSGWTAMPAQADTEGYRRLPPAVILDVDETVLDNSPFEARLLRRGETYGPGSWGEWVREAAAGPVPGALEFAREAARRGVTVFYVTNRDHELEPPTRRNLERLGFPLGGAADRILTEGEREGWGSDKADRRAFVADRYRVLLLVGDDLHDFTTGAHAGPAARRRLAVRNGERWGRQWIMLPNPVYGSWEEAAYGFRSGLSPAERRRAKIEALDAHP